MQLDLKTCNNCVFRLNLSMHMFQQHSQQTYCSPCHPLTFGKEKKLYLKIKFQSAPPEEKNLIENNTFNGNNVL